MKGVKHNLIQSTPHFCLFISDSGQMIVQVRQPKRKKEDEEGNDDVMKEKRKGRREGIMLIFGQLEKSLPLSVASS
jgi:hypothetical protein